MLLIRVVRTVQRNVTYTVVTWLQPNGRSKQYGTAAW